MVNKSQAFSWSRLLLNQVVHQNLIKTPLHISRKISGLQRFPIEKISKISLTRCYSTAHSRVVHDLLAEVEKEKKREREQRIRAGLDTKDIDNEDEEDYMGVGPLIEKLDKKNSRVTGDLNAYEEPSDSDSDADDERFSRESVRKRFENFQKKFERHKELLKNFTDAGMTNYGECLHFLLVLIS